MDISEQTNPKNKYKYCFSMEFADDEIYKTYLAHPIHLDFVNNFWTKMVEDFTEIDTELLIKSTKKVNTSASRGANTLPNETYYVGKWSAVLKGGPNGEEKLLLDFTLKDGKWFGLVTDVKKNSISEMKTI